MKQALIVAMWLGMTLNMSAGTIVWDNPGGGNWSAKANWKPKQVPGAGDLAVITNSGNYTVTLDVAAGIGGLVLGAGDGTTQTFAFNGQTLSLDGVATLNLGGQMDFSSGIFNGDTNTGGAVLSGTLTPAGGKLSGKFSLATDGVLNLTAASATNVLSDLIQFTNYGSVNWSNLNLYAGLGFVNFASGLQIHNYGLWDAQTDNTFFGNGLVFNNYNIFRKSENNGVLGSSSFDPSTLFNNFGTIDVQRGIVYCSHANNTGTINIATNALFSSAECYLGGTPTFSGAGHVSGTLTGNNAVIFGVLSLSNATLAGTLTLATNASVYFVKTNNSVVNFNGLLRLTNYGIVNWNDGDLRDGSFAQIVNFGLWNCRSNNVFKGGGSGSLFYNRGTFRKSQGTGITEIDSQFNFINSGVLDVQTGAILIRKGSGSGNFNMESNAGIYLVSYVLTGDPTFTGLGGLAGTITGSNAVVHGTENYSGGMGGFYGTLTLATNNILNIGGSSGSVGLNAVTLTNYGTVNWSNLELRASSISQIYNYGLWNCWTNGYFYGALGAPTVINNYGLFRKSGGTFFDSPSWTWLDNNTVFNNYGTLDVQAGGFNFNQLYDHGMMNIDMNSGIYAWPCYLIGNPTFSGLGPLQGTIISSNAVVNGALWLGYNTTLSGSLTVASNANINLTRLDTSSSSRINLNGLALTNYGVIHWNNVDMSASSPSKINNYGLWDCRTNKIFYGSSGAPTVFNNYGIFRKSGGALIGEKTCLDYQTTFNNAGTVEVQVGQLWFAGNYNLAGGTLNFGLSSPSDFGSLFLSGTGSLTGTLSVSLNSSFSPALSNAFALVSYPSSSGAFSAMNLPALASGRMWQSTYGATAFTLGVVAVPSPTMTSPTLTGGNLLSFAWASVPGQNYQVQFTTNLAPVNWLNLGSAITATNTTQSVTDLIGADPQRFYRVIVP